jgi:hypothetical protein
MSVFYNISVLSCIAYDNYLKDEWQQDLVEI